MSLSIHFPSKIPLKLQAHIMSFYDCPSEYTEKAVKSRGKEAMLDIRPY
jgi:hypothetical protein